MPTYSALTTLEAKEAADALAEAMEDFLPEPVGVGVFEIEDGSGHYEVGVYFEEAPDDTELALMAAIYGAKPFAVSEVPETDWVAHVKRELQPVAAGRFFVYGSHDANRVPDGSVALLIEAAMAFGTSSKLESGARSTKYTPSAKSVTDRAVTSTARRVLPVPPVPVRVSKRLTRKS